MEQKKIKGFLSEYDGRELSFKKYFEAVENGSEVGALPIPVLRGIKEMILDREEVDGIRVTSILGCTRKTFFEMNSEGVEYVKPSDYYAMFRGSIAHRVMEEFKMKGAIDEKRFIRKWKGIKITGKPDRIIPSQKKVVDYKTTRKIPDYISVYPYHEAQLNVYRWLVGEKYEIDNLEVIYMSMDTAKSCGARVWTDKELEEFLDKKVVGLIKAVKKNKVPAYEKTWECDYCVHDVVCNGVRRDEFIDELAQRLESGNKVTKGYIDKAVRNLTK